MAKSVYGIEGIDSLGKSSLIDGIRQRLGYYEVIHFGKPKELQVYVDASRVRAWERQETFAKELYQQESFRNSMLLATSGARLIFDRWHLGECVYSPLYRGTSGDYVFDLERKFNLDETGDIRLILLVEDFDRSEHFVSDGESFDDMKRREEQELFMQAFRKSIIRDKRIICVTDRDGSFRRRIDILDEAMA